MAKLALRTLLLAAATALAALLGALSPSPGDLRPPPTSAALFPRDLRAGAPPDGRVWACDSGEYAFGRWREPAGGVELHTDGPSERAWGRARSTLKTKAWHYASVNADRFFVGMAVVSLGYLADAFLYVVDKQSGEFEKYEFAGRRPGSYGLTFAASSIDDKVRPLLLRDWSQFGCMTLRRSSTCVELHIVQVC